MTEGPAPARAFEPVRLDSLTGLRAIAAFAVYLSHLPFPAGAPVLVITAMASGYCGVTFFFTLSGFVLAINYFDRLTCPSANWIWRFFTARIARVYPMYLLMLVYMLARSHQTGLPLPNWPEHALALQAWDPSLTVAFSYNGPAWSISVEFFLYAMFPLVVPLVARADRSVKRLLLLVTAVVAVMGLLVLLFTTTELGHLANADPSSAHRWLYRTPATRLGDFLLGILAARLYLRLRDRERMRALSWALVGGASLWTALAVVQGSLLFTPVSWDLLYAIPAFGLILGLSLAPRMFVARLLSLPLMILLGEASYAFYLIHQPFLAMLGDTGWARVVNRSTLAVQGFILLFIVAMAVGLHVIFEKPARDWLRKLSSFVPDGLARLRTSRAAAGPGALMAPHDEPPAAP